MDDPDGQPLGLAPIELSDKPAFDDAFGRLKAPLSDYTFANTFIWSTCLKLYKLESHRHLCVLANGTGDLTLLIPPMATAGATEADLRACLADCFEVMDRYNEKTGAGRARSRMEYVSEEMLQRMSDALPGKLNAAPYSGDYIYDMQRMIDLDGKKLKSKRHSRTKFLRDYPDHRIEPLTESHLPECLKLLHLWQHHGDAAHQGEVNEHHIGSDILRHRDAMACETALRRFRELGLTGMALLAGAQLIGFTLGEQIGGQASILIEKTHPEFYGSAQFIFSEFCRTAWSHLPECNVGDDWGIPSLKNVKQSYRPVRMMPKHTVTMQRPVLVAPGGIDVPLANPRHMVTSPVTTPTAEPVTYRGAQAGDVAALLELERTCFSTKEETLNKRQIRYLIGCPNAVVSVAQRGEKVIGWSVGLVRQHRRGKSGRVYAVAVHPEAQGHGIGRRLVQEVVTAMTQRGDISRIYLEVRHDNAPAIKLYRKLQFVEHRALPNYYGEGRHGVRMKLAVSGAPAATPAATVETTTETTTAASPLS